MTLYDIIVLLLLGGSALIGFVRGALREVITVLAFLGAVAIALITLRFTGPIGRQLLDPEWAGTAAAMLVVFVAVYVLIRVLGSGLQRQVHNTALGSIDRSIGVGFGLLRGLVAIGVFHLVFHAATPQDRVPQWISDAALYPLSEVCAKALSKLAPEGSAVAGRLGPHLGDAVREGSQDPYAGDGPAGWTTETPR